MSELSILEQLCFSTTRIETEDERGNNYSGTGFFFNLQIEDKIIPIVVTNKHVVKGMVKGMFLITERDSAGNPIYKSHFPVKYETSFESMWIMHPAEDIDLCILPYNMIVEAAQRIFKKDLFFRALDNSLIPTLEQLNDLDVVEDVLMIGYPNGLWDATHNMPII